ncbi:hypothetical protein CBOM_06031 [Ceraceosorus bombacis]|uniref:Transcription factor domain-containing protein n=1 Tax=Ceraceosorus bombacis TaxID=401625 RepID=A0A0P1BJ41_9BASI|nr:hypothetical protein CBOM_06031 [Ceraceosorus bombacis]
MGGMELIAICHPRPGRSSALLERSLETLLGALGDIRKSNAQESEKEKDTDDAGADPAQATLRKQLLALISNSAGDADKGEESASGNIDQTNTSERSGSVNSPMDDAASGLVSESAAEILWTLFMNHLNSPITLLDPNLATFAYARSHSALLLTAACALAARFALELPDAAGIASRLDSHIQTTILPAVLMEGFRSPEIAQALIIMAAYHNPTKTLADDRSWSLLGYGQRIASELDMNSSILSAKVGRQNGASPEGDDHSGSAELDEGFQRRLRSRERTWMNLFLFEQSLSTHMGRRSTLVVDPVVRESAAGWHRAPFAIADDEAVVAVLQLRLCVRKHLEFFDRSVAGGGAEHAALQLEFFRQSAKADVDAWRATWCEQRSGTYRMRNGRLYANYALIILYSFALRSTHVPTESLAPIYRDSFEASLTYLTLFLDIFTPQKLIYSNNSSTVTVAYVSVFALKLTALDPDKQRFAYINADQTFSLVGRVASALAAAGSVTPWREGCAGSYAPYLSAVLARARRAYRKRQQEGGTQVNGQHDLVASSGNPQAGGRDTNSDSHVQGDGCQKRARASGEYSVVGDVSPSHSSPDAFAFHAGPSGVQSSAHNVGTLENGNQPWDAQNHDMVSHLLESSLFTDMSFVNTGAGWEGAFEWPVGV